MGARRVGRLAAIVTTLAVAAGSAAACASSGTAGGGSGGGGGSTAFKTALQNIHTTAQTSGYIEFGDTAQLTKLNGGTSLASSGPFTRILGIGSDNLVSYESVLPPLTGFAALSAASAIDVGSPPDAVGVLYGSYDPAAIGAKLRAWGYHSQDRGDGVTAWIVEDDHKMDPSKLDPTTGIGPGMPGGWLNVIWVSKSRIAYAGATSDLAAALPAQSKPLSDDPVVGALADCLGPAVVAIVLTDPKQINAKGVSAVAFGVTATSASDVREEICASATDAAGAQAIATGFTKAVTGGQDFVTNQPWAKLLADPQTKVIGGPQNVAQLSAAPAAGGQGNAGLVVNLVEQNDFAGLLGLPQPAVIGRTDSEPTDTGSSSSS